MMRSSAVMAGGTAASRVLGFVRAALLVAVLGLGQSADAFALANTVPNAVYILLAGGVLNAVLVPQIARAAKQLDGGQDYINRLLTLTMTILFLITVTVTVGAPVLIRIYGTDKWEPATLTLATAFALWCLPQVFWYGMYTMFGQVLNARGSFGPFMWAPAVNNVVGIVGLLLFMAVAGTSNHPVDSWTPGRIALLAGTATLGVVAQALILIPSLKKAGIRFRFRWGLRGFGLRTAGRVAGWSFAAVLVQQFGYIVISRVSTTGGLRAAAADADFVAGLAAYGNAYLLFMLPHSLIAVSLVTALFTRMSVSATDNRLADVRDDLSLGLRLTGLATVLSAAAFLAIGPDITAIVFSGSPKRDTDAIAYVAMAMMFGLVAYSALYLFARAFYAFEDAKTPFLVQLPTVAVWSLGNLLSLLFLPPAWIVVGVGASMSVSNIAGAALSYYLLHRRLGELDGKRVLLTHLKYLLAAGSGGVVAFLLSRGLHAVLGYGKPVALLSALIGGVVVIGVYVAVLRLMKVKELDDALLPLLKRRR
jgi:putative peptidoglycan lipid II flippase